MCRCRWEVPESSGARPGAGCKRRFQKIPDSGGFRRVVDPDRPIVWNKSFKPVVQTIVLNFFLIEYRSIFLLGLYFFSCVLSSHPPSGLCSLFVYLFY